jgi:hypothetical protein
MLWTDVMPVEGSWAAGLSGKIYGQVGFFSAVETKDAKEDHELLQ